MTGILKLLFVIGVLFAMVGLAAVVLSNAAPESPAPPEASGMAGSSAELAGAVTGLLKEGFQAEIAVDMPRLHAMQAKSGGGASSLADFSQKHQQLRKVAQIIDLIGVDRPRLRGHGLAAAQVEYRINVLSGARAGTQGKMRKLIYARLEGGQWKILDTRYLSSKILPPEDDVASLGESVMLSLLWSVRKPDDLVIDQAVVTYDAQGQLTDISLEEWKKGELDRLGQYGQPGAPVLSQLLEHNGEKFRVRCGCFLATLDGSVLESLYDVWMAQVASTGESGGKNNWRVLSITPVVIRPTDSQIALRHFPDIISRETQALRKSIDDALQAWLKAPAKARPKALPQGVQLRSFEVKDVTELKNNLSPRGEATASVSASLVFVADRPPQVRSGEHSINMKRDAKGNWAITAIKPAQK
ncbi:MAG: hypothetical protein Q7T82_16310 [Armatimonadota bacterium]|nr:hypothetical protein [Armatimonadota bacterium]